MHLLASSTDLYLVDGVTMHHHFSFPSGHATAAFSMCLALAVIDGQRRTGWAWALLACILAFSRVYLSQHFTEDVLAGALVGTGTAVVVYHPLFRASFSHRPWLDRRPFRKKHSLPASAIARNR
ncbi:MAG: phosphatase PAP2 family protein [Flavobacteriales bacterium]|nr:phosphatase PAP2 family protein [Flavobacteriales bacterium]